MTLMPRRYSMETRAGDSDLKRRQILDAVVAVVAEEGLDALTVAAVASKADVAVRTVYNYFDSRDALLTAALAALADQTRTMVHAIAVADLPPREQMLAFADAYLRSYEEQGVAVSVLLSALAVPDVASAVGEVRAWRRDQIATIARDAQSAGVLRVSLTEAMSIGYLATAHSTYTQLTMDAGLSPAAARTTVRTMLDGALFR